MGQYKTCCTCKQSLDLFNFYKNRATKDGLQSCCKNCTAVANKKWQQKNKDKFAQYSAHYRSRNPVKTQIYLKNWRAKNKEHQKNYNKKYRELNPGYTVRRRSARRARQLSASTFTLTRKDFVNILRKPCIYCGQPSEHVDHVIPLSRGGNHSIGNLAPSCAKCNLSKGSKLVAEWRYKKVT